MLSSELVHPGSILHTYIELTRYIITKSLSFHLHAALVVRFYQGKLLGSYHQPTVADLLQVIILTCVVVPFAVAEIEVSIGYVELDFRDLSKILRWKLGGPPDKNSVRTRPDRHLTVINVDGFRIGLLGSQDQADRCSRLLIAVPHKVHEAAFKRHPVNDVTQLWW